jgi:hypothetical protein
MPTNISGEIEGSRATTNNPFPVKLIEQFNISQYDDIVLGYTGDDLTSVVYKLGVVTVATLTLTYTSGNLTGVTKS